MCEKVLTPQDKMILTDKERSKSNSPLNVLIIIQGGDDQLSIYLQHNFSQEHELLKDIKIGNTILKKVSTFNFGRL